MATLTYTVTVNGKEIKVKAKKALVQSFARTLADTGRVGQSHIELSGIIGGKEYSSRVMIIGRSAGTPIVDPTGYANDLKAFTEELPTSFTEADMPIWVKRAADLIKKHTPIVDNRKTQEQADAENAAYRESMKDFDAKALEERAEEEEKIAVLVREYPFLIRAGSGKSSHAAGSANLKTLLQKKFPGTVFSVKSNSFSGGNSIHFSWTDGPNDEEVNAIANLFQEGTFDGMNDSYNYHRDRAFSKAFGGAKYVSGQRQISATLMVEAAGAMGHEFTLEQWHSFESEAQQYAESAELYRTIRHKAHETSKSPDSSPSATQGGEDEVVGQSGIRAKRTNDHGKPGIEIRFAQKPGPEMISIVKNGGFRFTNHRGDPRWWAFYSDAKWEFAKNVALNKMEVAA